MPSVLPDSARALLGTLTESCRSRLSVEDIAAKIVAADPSETAAMIGVVQFLFGCPHRRTTFPLTPVRRQGRRGQTYICCLDCGAEIPYDWAQMRRGRARPAQRDAPLLSECVQQRGVGK